MPNTSSSILILDDDPVFLKLLELRINRRFPDITVDIRQHPVAVGIYDIYILDNDFQGRPLAADLAEEIKKTQPLSLVLALSGALCNSTLKRLINCGCNGAFDKSAPSEIDELLLVIDQHLKNQQSNISKNRSGSRYVMDTARSISTLIQDWNRRLELEERREQRSRVSELSSD
jgi:DNA-binding NtrC family response regulator